MSADLATVTRQGAGRQNTSSMKHWGTPKKYVDAVNLMFDGGVDLDPCSNEHSLVEAKVTYQPPSQDGLRQTWHYKKIYVNPPYGNDKESGTTIRHWLERCAHAHYTYGSEVLALVPVAVNTMHWKRHVFTRAQAVCFLYDTRLRFLEAGKDIGKGAPMACAMVYWGQDFGRFYDIFIKHGAVVDIRNLIGQVIGPDRKQASIASLRNEPTPRKANSNGARPLV